MANQMWDLAMRRGDVRTEALFSYLSYEARVPKDHPLRPIRIEAALASLWDDVAIQRCTVHKERNVLAHAPKHLHDEIKAEFNDMMHASTAEDVLGNAQAGVPAEDPVAHANLLNVSRLRSGHAPLHDGHHHS